MARLLTAGFESQDTKAANNANVESPVVQAANPGASVVTSAIAYDTTVFRSGAVSAKCDSGAANAAKTAFLVWPSGAVSTTTYARAYLRFTNLPGSGIAIMYIGSAASNGYACRITAGGKFQLWTAPAGGSQTGSDSTTTVTAGDGIWYRVEMSQTINASNQITAVELRVDGTTVASASGLTQAFTGVACSLTVGWDTGPGANSVMYVDDVAVNDSSGTNQTNFPGSGKIVLLVPTSDNSAGSWRAGSAANATANGALFAGIDNTPPAGTVTPLAVTAGISNAISGATNPNGDFNMTTYQAAGIAAADTINAITMIIVHGEDVATGTKTGTFTIVSNPAQTGTDTVGQGAGSQFGPAASGAVGTYATNWVAQRGTLQYPSSVTVGTAPVCRISKSDTGTRAADCCFMGLYVDYTPGAAAFVPRNPGVNFQNPGVL